VCIGWLWRERSSGRTLDSGLRPPMQTSERERERGILIRQSTPERGSVSPPGHHRSPTSPVSSRTGSSTFSYPTTSPSPLSKQLSTSSSSGGAHVRWNSAGANGARLYLSGVASDAGLDPTQVHYVASYSAAELRMFHHRRGGWPDLLRCVLGIASAHPFSLHGMVLALACL